MALGWISAYRVPGNVNTSRITLVSGTVQSSIALGASQCNIVGLMGLKRKRYATAPGYCYVTPNNTALNGWLETMNNNFTMTGPYAPTIGIDLAELRSLYHESVSGSGDRANEIQTWLRPNFVIEREKK